MATPTTTTGTTIGGGPVGGQVFSRDGSVGSLGNIASTGTRVFGPEPPGGVLGFGTEPGITFRVQFLVPTDFVAIDVIATDGFDPAELSAFDINGNLLAPIFRTEGRQGAGNVQVASLTRSVADIAFITVFEDGENFLLDNLRFNLLTVPAAEPGTLALAGLLAVPWLAGRRSAHRGRAGRTRRAAV